MTAFLTLWQNPLSGSGGRKVTTISWKTQMMMISLEKPQPLKARLTHDRINGPTRATCHTAVAQLDTSYPAVRHGYCSIPAAQTKLNRWIRGLLLPIRKWSIRSLVWNNDQLLCAFPNVRNCALGPPKIQNVIQISPRIHTISYPLNQAAYSKGTAFKGRIKERNLVTAFRPREKHRSSSPDWMSQLTDRHRGAFQSIALKKGGATPKKQSPTNSYTPFSTLTLIVPSILRNIQRTPTISQTWHAPELIPVPGMWRRERDTFTGLSFFFPLNLGSEVTTVEKVEKEAVCRLKPCLQKAGYCPREISRENNWVFAPLLCFSARKYLQDGCLRCAQPLLCSPLYNSAVCSAFPVMSQMVSRGLLFVRPVNYFCTHLTEVFWNEVLLSQDNSLNLCDRMF